MAIVYKKILNSPELKRLSPDLAQLLIERVKTVIIIKDVLSEIEKEMDEHLNDFAEKLKKSYKLRSLIQAWMSDSIEKERVNTSYFAYFNIFFDIMCVNKKFEFKKI